jgi:hypothetical protein
MIKTKRLPLSGHQLESLAISAMIKRTLYKIDRRHQPERLLLLALSAQKNWPTTLCKEITTAGDRTALQAFLPILCGQLWLLHKAKHR